MAEKDSGSKGDCGCGCGGRTVLLYACSGAANVAEVADLAARQLAAEGMGKMFCMAGVAAGIENMVQTAQAADLNVVIDGCPMECARKVFDKAGVRHIPIQVTDMGIEKTKGARATKEQVKEVVIKVKKIVADN